MYALLVDKSAATCKEMFSVVKDRVTVSPLTVQTDFEVGLFGAIAETWPECTLYGCYFHLKQNIWRHIQTCGLVQAYRDLESPIRQYCKLLVCLAFLPLTDVVEAFETIQTKAPKECVPLYRYFEENYIGNRNRGRSLRPRKDPMFALTQWNVRERTMEDMPRTSNNVEGWHNGFTGMIKKHPHLLALIDAIKTEQTNMEHNHVRLSTGLVHKRKKKWVEIEERIVALVTDYKKDNLEEWLRRLSLMIQY